MTTYSVTILFFLLITAADQSLVQAKLLSVQKIWDKDSHSAFTDLIWWRDQFICCFRTGSRHVSPDGQIQVLRSTDGQSWQPLARVTMPGMDLRDPKLFIGPSDELGIVAAAAFPRQGKTHHQSQIWMSTDGKNWGSPRAVCPEDEWLWRVTAHRGKFYGWTYGTGTEHFIRLYDGVNGRNFDPITARLLGDKGQANETALSFHGNQALCLLRRDGRGQLATGLLGTSSAPFRQWIWRDLGVQIGGPALLQIPDGRCLAVVRLYQPKVRTALCLLDPAGATLKELLTLPSGGDTSYAGMAWRQDRLWISYYSSHEGKTSIYLAQVQIKKP